MWRGVAQKQIELLILEKIPGKVNGAKLEFSGSTAD
jgi:hypothetical protein